MAFNLLELIKDQVSDELVKHASEMLGESESGITKALGGVFSSVLGSLISKGTEESTASGMFDLVKSADPSILGNIGGLLDGSSDDKPDSLLNMGTRFLSSLMGDKLGGAVDLISKMGGIKSGSAVSLFKMATPFLMALISKKVSSDGMGLSEFMALLNEQKESVSEMLPKGMGSLMGLTSVIGSAKDALRGTTDSNTSVGTGAVSSTTTATVVNNSGAALFKWLIPALIILGSIYLLTQSKMCKGTVLGDTIGNTMGKGAEMTADVMDTIADLASDAAGTIVDDAQVGGNGVTNAFSNVDEAAKATLEKISFAAGSVGSQMMDFINEGAIAKPTFSFNYLNFETGSTTIASDSGTEIDNLASILMAYPDAKVRIDAYTESAGDETASQKLSEGRANAVKARLEAKGIDGARVSAKGYGEANPVVDSEKADGTAQNKRIILTIIE